MNANVTKVVVVALLALTRFLSGFIPLAFSRKIRQKRKLNNSKKTWVDRVVHLSMQFSGGILLGTCFLHMLPEVRHNLQNTLTNRYIFPYAELLVCAGFFVVYLLEESIKPFVESNRVETPTEIPEVLIFREKEQLSVLDDAVMNVVPCSNIAMMTEVNSLEPELNNNQRSPETEIRSIFIVIALSFHSIMEGLAIGLEEDSYNVWYLFIAISLHECIILFFLGIDIVIKVASNRSVIYRMTTVALSTPLGAIIGIIAVALLQSGSSLTGHSLTISILQCLSTGTILYVTFFELLTDQHQHSLDHIHIHGLLKFFSVLFGFAMMVLLEVIGGRHVDDSRIDHEMNCTNSSL